ncbi:hypothetical protein ACFXGA_06045 [Actinosynnema sp. NPDC059335]|uniref:hypothetical protein n=1 Tax=Actinosynnema sp. NPDC059335 TaxID=3346804 RepID=UPI003672E648
MSNKHELHGTEVDHVGLLVSDLTAVLEQGWREVARTHRRALDGRCGTCGDRWPCRAYREATRSRGRAVKPVKR